MKEGTSFIKGQRIINKNNSSILSFDYNLRVGMCKVSVFTNDMGDTIRLTLNDLLEYNLFISPATP